MPTLNELLDINMSYEDILTNLDEQTDNFTVLDGEVAFDNQYEAEVAISILKNHYESVKNKGLDVLQDDDTKSVFTIVFSDPIIDDVSFPDENESENSNVQENLTEGLITEARNNIEINNDKLVKFHNSDVMIYFEDPSWGGIYATIVIDHDGDLMAGYEWLATQNVIKSLDDFAKNGIILDYGGQYKDTEDIKAFYFRALTPAAFKKLDALNPGKLDVDDPSNWWLEIYLYLDTFDTEEEFEIATKAIREYLDHKFSTVQDSNIEDSNIEDIDYDLYQEGLAQDDDANKSIKYKNNIRIETDNGDIIRIYKRAKAYYIDGFDKNLKLFKPRRYLSFDGVKNFMNKTYNIKLTEDLITESQKYVKIDKDKVFSTAYADRVRFEGTWQPNIHKPVCIDAFFVLYRDGDIMAGHEWFKGQTAVNSLDDFNWMLRYKGIFTGYEGTIIFEFEALTPAEFKKLDALNPGKLATGKWWPEIRLYIESFDDNKEQFEIATKAIEDYLSSKFSIPQNSNISSDIEDIDYGLYQENLATLDEGKNTHNQQFEEGDLTFEYITTVQSFEDAIKTGRIKNVGNGEWKILNEKFLWEYWCEVIEKPDNNLGIRFIYGSVDKSMPHFLDKARISKYFGEFEQDLSSNGGLKIIDKNIYVYINNKWVPYTDPDIEDVDYDLYQEGLNEDLNEVRHTSYGAHENGALVYEYVVTTKSFDKAVANGDIWFKGPHKDGFVVNNGIYRWDEFGEIWTDKFGRIKYSDGPKLTDEDTVKVRFIWGVPQSNNQANYYLNLFERDLAAHGKLDIVSSAILIYNNGDLIPYPGPDIVDVDYDIYTEDLWEK